MGKIRSNILPFLFHKFRNNILILTKKISSISNKPTKGFMGNTTTR